MSKTARPQFFQAWAIYREHWLRPFISDNDLSLQELAVCPIHEQINGQIANSRQFMREIMTSKQTSGVTK